jgi:hypothetical protein
MAQTVLLLGQWMMAVAEASDGFGLPGLGQGLGEVLVFLVLNLMLWSFARSAREAVKARSAHQPAH